MEGRESCLCGQPDNDEMVQCDICDGWFHFKCVGVGPDIADRDWMCAKCGGASTTNTGERITVDSNEAGDGDNFQSPMNSNEVARNKVGKGCVSIPSSMGAGNKSNIRRNVETELRRLEEEHKINMLFIERKYKIMAECDGAFEHDGGTISDDENRGEIIGHENVNTSKPDCMNTKRRINYNQQGGDFNANLSAGNRGTVPMPSNTFLRYDQAYSCPAIPRELPAFSGKPEEWPLFISSYENSTRLCGFDNDVNLLRLQRALKGKALEYVSSKLTLPALVPEVIATLRMLFGRPENIIHNLLAKLRAGSNVNANKLDTLVLFALDVKNIVSTMEAANLHAHLNNPMLISELVSRLPAQIRLDWAVYSRALNIVNLTEFSNWLFNLAEAASSVITTIEPHSTVQENVKRKPSRINIHEERTVSGDSIKKRTTESKCFACDESGHFIAKCDKFKKFTYEAKWNLVRDKKLCRSCLTLHDSKFCRNRKVCGVSGCSIKHNPLLHKPEFPVNRNDSTESVVAVHNIITSSVLYRIIPITIHGRNSNVTEYALLDEASGPTLIEESVLRKLNIHGERSELCVKWTDGSLRLENNSERVSLKISPRGHTERQYLLRDVRSVGVLDLPRQTLIFSELAERYKHLRGLPVESYENVIPKIIIGLNNKKLAIPLKFKEGGEDEPAALKSRLGWTIYGSVGPKTVGTELVGSINVGLQLHVCECHDEIAIQKLMKQSIELEDEGIVLKKSDNYSNTTIKNFVKRTEKGFTVKLLWKADNLIMPNNYHMALRRMKCFEGRLQRDDDLRISVNDRIKQMLDKGYIRKLSKQESSKEFPRCWYLPIFAVKNPNKPEKMRIVWDAAAECEGVSLNSCLNKGPDLLTPLINVLFNFRIGKIGINGDISEMFHRVAVDEDDANSQRFLWRNCDNKREPDTYILQVMSFGASCSPSLAQFVKNVNADDFEREFPRAVKSIKERHYVDDMLDSVDTIDEAISLAKQVREIHRRGNFHIRNWMSNAREVIAAMGEEGDTQSFCKAGQRVEQVVEPEKVLGMWWNTENDSFTFSLKYTKATMEILSGQRLPTKRELLRLVMSIFDPLGFLSFYTVQMRILLQNVWRKEISWDEPIPDEFSREWLQWLSALRKVESTNVPRCYFGNVNIGNSKIQLHVFVDASENAYAAVAYFRIESQNNVETSLVASRTKVAPLRPVSVPRMELLAAVLGSRLATTIKNSHDLQIKSTLFWTDSRTVLLWLKSDPRRFKQFVKFRVAEIQDNTSISGWNYVPSRQNVADLATKWVGQPKFDSTTPWFIGPPFLRQRPEEWPKYKDETAVVDSGIDNIEGQHVAVHLQQDGSLIDLTRFSKYERLLRSVAYVKRFIEHTLFRKSTTNCLNLTSEQLHWSQMYLVRLAQSHAYAYEIALLQRDPTCIIPKTSKLRKLSPFLDDNKILRLRGRLGNAKMIPYDTKEPMILPKSHCITYLLVDWYHRKYKHVNHETVINEIFQKYHIQGVRTLLRTIRKKCMMCKMRDAKPKPPEMGPLPSARLSAFTRPFSFVGVDFFGPFTVTVGRRNEKRYGAIFTCLTIRAVHIELAFSLDMNSCVMVIRNFIARRGMPLHIYSDNGTNLKAAEKELREAYSKIDFQLLQQEFTSPDVKWSFIPPLSLHMGGAWERMVRSIKTVLYRIITPDQKLNDERLHNLFLEVETIINCRPLTYLSLESADQEALTPNHFLLGNSSGNKPPGIFEESDIYLRKSWRHSQLLADKFWKRWIAEVLPAMTKRSKWFDKVKPIKIGDVVMIVDSSSPRHCWPKGIVTATILAKDGQVRSVLVKTASGTYHRPATKIAVLDVLPAE